MKQVLRIAVFRRLLAAYLLNELAWSVGTLALALLVYRRTGSAIGSTGFFLCSQVLPALISPALVAKLDRRAPSRLLPVLYAIEAVLFGVLAWMTSRFAVAPVLVLALLDGVVAIIARAMAATVRVQVLRPLDLVPEGNVVANAGFAICFMAGPLLGGLVVVAGGTVTALLANCGLFAVMGVLLATAGLPGRSEAAGPTTGRLRGALAHARADRGLWRLLVLQGIGLACFTISIPVEVVYAQRVLHAGADGYGALLSAWGGGAVAGSIVIARWRRRSARFLIGASALALAIGFFVMTAAPSLALGVVGSAIAGRRQRRGVDRRADRHPAAGAAGVDGADHEPQPIGLPAGARPRHPGGRRDRVGGVGPRRAGGRRRGVAAVRRRRGVRPASRGDDARSAGAASRRPLPIDDAPTAPTSGHKSVV